MTQPIWNSMGRLVDNSIVYNIVTMTRPLAAVAGSIWLWVGISAAVVTAVTSYQLWVLILLSAPLAVYFFALAYAADKIAGTFEDYKSG